MNNYDMIQAMSIQQRQEFFKSQHEMLNNLEQMTLEEIAEKKPFCKLGMDIPNKRRECTRFGDFERCYGCCIDWLKKEIIEYDIMNKDDKTKWAILELTYLRNRNSLSLNTYELFINLLKDSKKYSLSI